MDSKRLQHWSHPIEESPWSFAGFGIGAIIILPIIYGCVGFIAMLLIALARREFPVLQGILFPVRIDDDRSSRGQFSSLNNGRRTNGELMTRIQNGSYLF